MRCGPVLLTLLALLVRPAPLSAQLLLEFSADERARIAAHGPWPPPAVRDRSNRVDGRASAIALGRRLFADTRLSADGSMSCATCHRPELAFQDGHAVARGRAPGRRNTPGLLDVAQQRWFGWDGGHDTLWGASLAPILDPREMAGSLSGTATLLRSDPVLASAFRRAFGGGPPVDDETAAVDAAKALAAYLATLASPRTPFDAFRDALLRGDRRAAARYPLAAQRGLKLFIGSARCHLCHAGPLFSHGEFADVGRPFFLPGGGVDAGRHEGLRRLLADRGSRLGPYSDAAADDPRAALTRHLVPLHRHFGEFRVPGLRQLELTAPYMHDGSLATLEDVVRHYSELDEDRLHADGERILRRLDLTPQQSADLRAFLRSLSSPDRAPRPRSGLTPAAGSARWPRRPGRRSGNARCRTGARHWPARIAPPCRKSGKAPAAQIRPWLRRRARARTACPPPPRAGGPRRPGA